MCWTASMAPLWLMGKLAAGKHSLYLDQTTTGRSPTDLGPVAIRTRTMRSCLKIPRVGSAIVQDVLDGFNGTIMAYGQTGSGKTFTIFGPDNNGAFSDGPRPGGDSYSYNAELFENPESWGVIPRAVHQLFSHIEQQNKYTEFRVVVSFLQIYLETIHDLLDPRKTNLVIREDPKSGVFVDQLTQAPVTSASHLMQTIAAGARNRATSSTLMNKASSRSHVMLMLSVEQRQRLETGIRKVKRGVLTIVDLAGSERVSKSGSEGQRLEEAKKINKSLCALGNCVASLTDTSATHVPFRDSKLTRLLTDSLGGNSRMCLCANVGPAMRNFDETHSALLFAQRCMAVKNSAQINEADDFKSFSKLQARLCAMEGENSALLARNDDLQKQVGLLQREVDTIVQERESALRNKYETVIQHLQKEIANQSRPGPVTPAPTSEERREEMMIEFIDQMLQNPRIRDIILERIANQMSEF
eukprot:TRINITY_DN10409_c0_g1_i1.p1 TRINITY_DN10409_c0_g1~~TRINITY_DN10409_c0_g1_i1.p1  ORF type:complete len:471 (+),score=66.67 TRINITY_DN10409_c0_g1_i1:508-1920(+)